MLREFGKDPEEDVQRGRSTVNGQFDLDRYLSLPRVDGLELSPDGSRLVTTVATVGPDGRKFVTSLWELDPDGRRPPRRLTRSAAGESGPVFLPGGDLLLRSARADPQAAAEPDGDGAEEEPQALWLLAAAGGEARQVGRTPGGIGAVRVARDAGTVVYASGVHPGASTLEEDERTGRRRRDAGVGAQLFEGYPIRFWDHYLGPREQRLFAADAPRGDEDRLGAGRDLTPEPGFALDEAEFDLTPDGATIVTTWRLPGSDDPRNLLVAIETASGERRVLVEDPEAWHGGPACSPDGRLVAYWRESHGDLDRGPEVSLWLADLATGERREALPGAELWPRDLTWAPDSGALYFVADQQGLAPLFRLDLTGEDPAGWRLTRLTGDGAYAAPRPSPDGDRVYALRDSLTAPPCAVVLDARAADQSARALPSPGLPLEVPGTVTTVRAQAGDGTPVRSWLVLPSGAGAGAPAPLVVFIHGGPLSSWNGWSWRWNPHLLAARGYAVLLPDPGLSTGYGQRFAERGRGRWGAEPFGDLMAAVDAAAARPDIDPARMAATGGSFGGYMANWVAGSTTRFRCIVTHASVWSLEQFHGTTDESAYWRLEFGAPEEEPERYRAHSPDRLAPQIRTPMLVIHGELDHRVPIGEALRLWTDLTRFGVDAKFLYFPDENHWILKPPNIRIWYETVFAYLDHHVLGKDWSRPSLL
jgi:dipeptidyl aminopeptidase/acylaminoacyl peptidase